ncbi:MAG TPA: carbohydrate ABC transporter permease, partial [Candidatus Tectomicrobia bacterium]|nr:carbohydrate ABC transporter permease [Candidatus Tectomicrobia bacterium]
LWASPVAWQLLTSVMPDAALLQPGRLEPPTLAHYEVVVTRSPMPRGLLNSLVVALATTALAAALGTLGGYALARLPVPGRGALMLGIVTSTAFPAIATVAPLYLVVRALGLRDTWAALVLADASFTLPLALWLIAGFVRDVPPALEEAALVDGASRLGALRHVVLPVLAPGIAAASLVAFLFAWNEFLFAYTFTATEASRTAPVALALFPGVFEVPWGDLAAASVLASLPPVLIVLLLRRHLISGLLAGALKD